MKAVLKKIPPWIVYLFILFIVLLFLFSVFRHVFFKLNVDVSQPIPGSFYSNSLSLGTSYDTMVASYLLLIPALAFFVSMFFNYNSLWFRRSFTFYFGLAFFIVLLACSADIPFYKFCGSRLSTAIVMWTDTPGIMLKFVLENSEYYPYLAVVFIGFALSVILLVFLQKKLLKDIFREKSRLSEDPSSGGYSVSKKVVVFLCVSFLLLIGIRGGWRERPIAIRDAFVTNFPFVNLLPLNPVHSFFDSMEKINLNYLDNKAAINNARRYLNAQEHFDSPIARKISFSDSAIKPNFVLVLMESMSAEMTGLSSSGKSFTPNLDSLSKKSISFSRFYTCGMHTSNGLYGVLDR